VSGTQSIMTRIAIFRRLLMLLLSVPNPCAADIFVEPTRQMLRSNVRKTTELATGTKTSVGKPSDSYFSLEAQFNKHAYIRYDAKQDFYSDGKKYDTKISEREQLQDSNNGDVHRTAYSSNDNAQNVETYWGNQFLAMFETAPHYWAPMQWFFFAMFVMLSSAISFCFCILCIIPRCCGKTGTIIYASML